MYAKNFDVDQRNAVIDVLNKMNSSDLFAFAQENGFEALKLGEDFILSQTSGVTGLLDKYNFFLGLNMSNSPQSIIKEAWAAGAWGLVIGAIMIPLLSALTQWISVKLMPQADNGNKKSGEESAMESSLKTMNVVMPFMSAWLCYTLPCGMGIYWVAGSVVRGVIQVFCNKHFDRMDLDKLIQKNEEKSAKKLEKMKQQQEMMAAYASMNTKKIQNKASYNNSYNSSSNDNSTNNSTTTNTNNTAKAKPGSMMAKANMVKEYNERNNKN